MLHRWSVTPCIWTSLLQVLPEDNLLAVGKVHGDFCNLEIYLYNEKDENLYCHHDILLGSFPLALEWLDYDPGDASPGNLVAMGSMQPDIEIWDVDVIDSIEPAYVLKGMSGDAGLLSLRKSRSPGLHRPKLLRTPSFHGNSQHNAKLFPGAEVKTSKKKKKKTSSSGHTDAVLDLSWNRTQRKVLASASADFSVGVWDLEQGTMATSLTQHTEKVGLQPLSKHRRYRLISSATKSLPVTTNFVSQITGAVRELASCGGTNAFVRFV